MRANLAQTLRRSLAIATRHRTMSTSKIPSVEIFDATFPPSKLNLAEYCAGKNVVIIGLPGAFTPT